MRTHRQLVVYQSILQVLQETGCPFCRFLKEYQTARLQNHSKEDIHRLCNFHAWGLAAVQNAPAAAQVFIKLVDEPPSLSKEDSGCDVCREVLAEEDLRLREFVSCITRTDVRIGCEGQQCFVSHTGQSCANKSSLFLLPGSTPSSKTAASSWRKSCNICVMKRSRTELAGAQ
jgi:hypothetical protein